MVYCMTNNKYTVLIIDDEEIVLDSCFHSLASENYNIITTSDACKGLKIIEKNCPDLVFVDLQMPKISGLEVLERIHSIDKNIVTIMITGYPSINSAIEAVKKGACNYIAKPFTPQELRLIAQIGLERRQLLIENANLRREKELIRENIVIQDFKIPLSGIKNDLMILLNDQPSQLEQKPKKILENIKKEVDLLIRLTKIWLEYTCINFSTADSLSIPKIDLKDFN